MPVDIIVPPLSQTSDTLILLEWLKKPGDKVEKGEALFTVETDKASLEVESPESGTLLEIYAQPQSEITVRSIIGKIIREGEKPPEKEIAPEKTSKVIEKPKKTKPRNEIVIQKKSVESGRIFSSPRARKIARREGLNIADANATGPRGMVVERDVRQLLKSIGTESQPQSSIRQVIAKRMMESHLGSAPVSYLREADATNLVKFREQLLKNLKDGEIRPTFTDFFIRILCLAVLKHPEFNAVVEGELPIQKRNVNLALAIDTERGLIVPVMKFVNNLPFAQIAAKRKELVEKTLSGKLSADEMTGGTFTLTNLGTMGIDYFTPIINPPQVAILGIGRIREAPAVRDGGIYVRNMVNLSLTCDHRFIDGGPAARFLETIAHTIENTDNKIL